MNKMKRFITVCLFFAIISICMITPHADTIITLDGYSYIDNGYGLATLVGWDNRSETLYVPANVGNVYFASIGDSAFSDDDYIRTLDVNDAVRLYSIGMYAFSRSALEGELSIPSRITHIGTSAFERTNLENIIYASGGGVVSAQCFQYCMNLQSVTLTSFITTIDRYAFRGCSNLSSIIIPSTVTSINRTALVGCDHLTIYCYTDSYAHQYAEDMGIEYVLIDAPAPTEPPTEPETEAPTEPETEAPTDEPTLPTESVSYYLGDVDGNDIVDVVDATWIQRYNAYMTYPMSDAAMSHGDVDVDGEVTIYDATYIRRYTVYIDTPYEIGQLIKAE